MTSEEARAFLRSLTLYKSRVRVTKGSTVLEGVVLEVGDFKGREGLRVENIRHVVYLTGKGAPNVELVTV